MVSYRKLLSEVESVLCMPDALPGDRAHLMHLLRQCMPAFKDFLKYPVPKGTDRSQVLSKEVRLPNSPPTLLDDQDVQIALKLSDDLYLNEIDSVSLIVAAHQEWGLLGREPLEVLRLSAGLWFEERKAMISTLLILLKTAVLDDAIENDLVCDIGDFLGELFSSGLRERLFMLIKELNREEPAGFGGPQADRFVIDVRGMLVERYNLAQTERLCLCQCVVLSVLVSQTNPQEARHMVTLLKDCAADRNDHNSILKAQIAYTLLFGLVIALVSEAISVSQDISVSLIFKDTDFRREFQASIMAIANDVVVDGYMDVVRFSWAVFLMMTSEGSFVTSSTTINQPVDTGNIKSCLDHVCSKNVFKFLLVRIMRTTAFQNDDQELLSIYSSYLHKMLTCFLSQAIGRDKVKELKDMAMNAIGSYSYGKAEENGNGDFKLHQKEVDAQSQPFICLLELLTEIYEKEPKLIDESEAQWNFVRFAGEDHTCYQTLVAFLDMLAALSSSEEGSRKVYHLLQNRTIRTVGWHTLFASLNFFEKNFQQSIHSSTTVLPEIAEGDARALVGYLKVLRKVMSHGNSVERTQWFSDIEPLFKLLPYENVPPYLKGALRNAIAVFVEVSPSMKDTVWSLLAQYDLPVDLGPTMIGKPSQDMSSPVYDMAYELNEIEARREEYPSTLSYLRLLNVLIKSETDLSDSGRRFFGIYKFVRDEIFGLFSQRAYANLVEKWDLVVACLQHFKMMLVMYNISEEDIIKAFDDSVQGERAVSSSGVCTSEIPGIDLMKDFMSGKTVLRNVMSILMLKATKIAEDRYYQIYGRKQEEAVALCLELIVLVLQKDSVVADQWRPIFQPLDVILACDGHQIVALLEYISYDLLPSVQQSSVRIMNILSGRMVQLVSVIREVDSGGSLIEDYASCLEARILDYQASENPNEDIGFLILQLLINNVSRPAPNVTHFLLRFDIDGPVEKTVLQPRQQYSCLRVILNILETFSKREVNAMLYEFGLQLMYELCVDSVTRSPIVELLRNEKYQFFSKHLDSYACSALPRRNNQAQRICELHQRSWLLKIFAFELNLCDMDVISHRESCRRLVSKLFLQDSNSENSLSFARSVPEDTHNNTSKSFQKMKALELLDIIQFQPPEVNIKFWLPILKYKVDFKVDEILENRNTVDRGGIYYYSERGDRLIDLSALRDKLWQEYKRLEGELNDSYTEGKAVELKNAVQQLLKWGWKYNRNLEEQAAQLHMLYSWSQLVEVGISRRADLIRNRPYTLYEILDASLTASISQDCSLKMALILNQVVLTCMAKLHDQSFLFPGEESADNVTYVDLLRRTCLSNSACHSILLKLINSILRRESSESLRRRQYAIFLSYYQYCRGMTDPEASLAIKRNLLLEGEEGEDDLEIQKIEKDQRELTQMNSTILKRQSSALVEVVTKDATLGSEAGKSMAFYVLDALLGLDQDQVFLTHLQKRNLLHRCLTDISNNAYQAVLLPSTECIRRLYTIEAELSLLLRVSYQYKKRGLQMLLSLGVLEQLSSCKAIDVQLMEESEGVRPFAVGMSFLSQTDRYHQLVQPVLRLVFSLTSLIDVSEFLETTNKLVHEIVDFIKSHLGLFGSILRDDASHVSLQSLEELELTVGILARVWPYEEKDKFGILHALFKIMHSFFCENTNTSNKYVDYVKSFNKAQDYQKGHFEWQKARRIELLVNKLRCSLASYLYCLVRRKDLRLPVSRENMLVSDISTTRHCLYAKQNLPGLELILDLLCQASKDLESVVDEKFRLFRKIHDVNELSRHEVDEILEIYGCQQNLSVSDGIRKRRYIAMAQMCSAVGHNERLTTLLLHVLEHALNILYIHFEERLQAPEQFKENSGSFEDIMSLKEKILLPLEKLESLNEGQVGYSLKLLHRLVNSLKSIIFLRTQY